MNSPHLRLNSTHSNEMNRIGEWVRKNNTVNTNLADFWHTLAHVSEGKKLSGSSCGIDNRQGILMNGITKFCYWVNDPVYGKNDELVPEGKRIN
mgnify:CR=1 FL=1